jgi:hypothetical protein
LRSGTYCSRMMPSNWRVALFRACRLTLLETNRRVAPVGAGSRVAPVGAGSRLAPVGHGWHQLVRDHGWHQLVGGTRCSSCSRVEGWCQLLYQLLLRRLVGQRSLGGLIGELLERNHCASPEKLVAPGLLSGSRTATHRRKGRLESARTVCPAQLPGANPRAGRTCPVCSSTAGA